MQTLVAPPAHLPNADQQVAHTPSVSPPVRLRPWVGDLADKGMNHVTAITFSCAAIHFTTVTYIIIKDQFLSYQTYMVWKVKDT